MKAKLELLEVTKLDLGTPVAVFELQLQGISVIMESTGMSLVVKSQHPVRELLMFADWIVAPSNNDETCRDNEAEIIIHAKQILKMHRELWKLKTI